MKPKIHRKPLSRFFPSYHPKKGQKTFFVEKLWNGLEQLNYLPNDSLLKKLKIDYDRFLVGAEKWHTIRQGNKIKVGDFVEFYIWEGRPYWSKPITICPPIEVKKVFDFTIDLLNPEKIYIDGHMAMNSFEVLKMPEVAKNDGLNLDDLLAWFKYPKPFIGQIICWNDKIQY